MRWLPHILFFAIWSLVGFCVGRFPGIAAGYCTMVSPGQRKDDIRSTGRFVSRLIYAGALTALAGGVLPGRAGIWCLMVPVALVFAGMIYANYRFYTHR